MRLLTINRLMSDDEEDNDDDDDESSSEEEEEDSNEEQSADHPSNAIEPPVVSTRADGTPFVVIPR